MYWKIMQVNHLEEVKVHLDFTDAFGCFQMLNFEGLFLSPSSYVSYDTFCNRLLRLISLADR